MKKHIIYGVLISLYYFFGIHTAFTLFGGMGLYLSFKPSNMILLTLVNFFAFYEMVLHLNKRGYFHDELKTIINISFIIIIVITNLILFSMSANTNVQLYELLLTTLSFIYIKYKKIL